MGDYTDYHQAMQHAALNANQLHQIQTQIPMSQLINATGLNLTVMPGQLGQGHQLGHGQHQILYTTANVQPTVQAVVHQQPQQHAGGHGGGHGHQTKKEKKKSKVNKDGVPAPKRAATAFINFTQWYREELKKNDRPVPKITEFGKECAAKWAQMSEDEKKPFTSAAQVDRERYQREMAVYKPARDETKPKRPGTAFMLFMVDFRKEYKGKEPSGGVAALAKLGGERWRNMTEEDKRPYVDSQNTERAKYEVSMEEYRKTQQATQSVAGGSRDSDSESPVPQQLLQQATLAPAAHQQLQQQQQQQQIQLAQTTTAYVLSNGGATYSHIQTPYTWN